MIADARKEADETARRITEAARKQAQEIAKKAQWEAAEIITEAKQKAQHIINKENINVKRKARVRMNTAA